MSSLRSAPRRLERYRGKPTGQKIQEKEGKGKALAMAAKKLNVQAALQLKKKSSKVMQELESLDTAALKVKLAEARKLLLDSRFKHAVAQLEKVDVLKSTKRQIARILTLIKQKEMGA